MGGKARTIGAALLWCFVAAAAGAPVVSPHAVDRQFQGLLNAPPTPIHLRDEGGAWHAPFIYRLVLLSQLEQRYGEDRGAIVPLSWMTGGHLVASSDDERAPLLLLGADSFGRDVFGRLLLGGRTSLALAMTAALGAMLVGGTIGALSGWAGGWVDEGLMRGADLVLVLPATYVVLALRSVLPLVLAPQAVFLMLASIFAIVGAPFIARGVRGIVRTERQLDYAVAAVSIGGSPFRVLARHLLPATRGFVVVQLTLLVPAFIVAEATLSFVGLGFSDSVASWGTMLQEASSLRAFVDFPWLLSPAVAMFLVVFAVNLVVQESRQTVP